MAEILIKAVDATHSDPEKDAVGCYKRGDMVVVAPDGHVWGKEEGLPKFVVVKVPGLSVEKARDFIEEQREAATVRRTWMLSTWQEALLSGVYGRFLAQPAVVRYFTVDAVELVELEGQEMCLKKRRAWRLLVDTLPQSVKDTLASTGEYTTTLSQIRNYIENKMSRATY